MRIHRSSLTKNTGEEVPSLEDYRVRANRLQFPILGNYEQWAYAVAILPQPQCPNPDTPYGTNACCKRFEAPGMRLASLRSRSLGTFVPTPLSYRKLKPV